jgi:ketosteroid isomerase-like protein
VLSANRELDRKFAEAVVGLDLDGIMQCWWNSPDVRRYPADNLDGLAGWASIKAAWGHQITGMQRVLRFEISGQTYFIRGDAVIGTGRIDLRIVPKGSPGEVEMSMRFTDLREQKEGRWVYVYSHESLSPMSVLNDPGLLTYE